MPEVTPTPANVEAAENCAMDLLHHANAADMPASINPTILARHIAAAVLKEREACAKISETFVLSTAQRAMVRRQYAPYEKRDWIPADYGNGVDDAGVWIADAIRARSEA